MLDAALANLNGLALVGITEAMDASMLRLSDVLKIPVSYDGSYINRTSTNHLTDCAHFGQQRSFDEVDRSTLDLIEAANVLDIAIYREAVTRMFGRPTIENRLTCLTFQSTTLQDVDDDGHDWMRTPEPGWMTFGPYVRLFRGRYTARFRIRRQDGAKVDDVVGRVEVACGGGERTIADAAIAALQAQFEINIDFTIDVMESDVEFRTSASRAGVIDVCRQVTLLGHV